jgi:hypothetical protein
MTQRAPRFSYSYHYGLREHVEAPTFYLGAYGQRRTLNQVRNSRKGPGRSATEYSRSLPKVRDLAAPIRASVAR